MNCGKVTIKDIARECGVSITTVSRVLNNIGGCCRPEVEAKILTAVRELNYYPNPIAKSLVTKRTNMIAVLIPDIHNLFFQEFYKGVEEIANSKGYKILLCNTDAQLAKEKAFLNELSQGTVDGIIVTTLNKTEDDSDILRLSERNFPIVTVERYGADLKDICRVVFDNQKAMEIAVKKLYENGHRRIAFITGPADAINGRLRKKGYEQALHELNIPFQERLICNGDYKMDTGYRCIRKLLKNESFTAILASNDLMAIGACKAVREAGLSVPKDISVIGFDGTLLAEIHQPPLTTLIVFGHDMGKVSAKNLLKIINGKEVAAKVVQFAPSIREGESVRDIRKDM